MHGAGIKFASTPSQWHLDHRANTARLNHREAMRLIDEEIDGGAPLIFVDVTDSVERSKATCK